MMDRNSIQLKNIPDFFNKSFVVGIVFSIASLIALFIGQEKQFYFSALTSGIFCLGIMLGALCFVMIHYLTGAKWSVTVLRTSEVMAAIAPYAIIILAIVILMGIHHLYSWANPEIAASDHLIHKKVQYLNIPFFVVRMFIYAGVWIFLTRFFLKNSSSQDQSGQPANLDLPKKISPVGMILFALTVTFSAFDWMMSLDPHWYSTIFGVYIFAGYFMSFFAASILLLRVLHRYGYLKNIVTVEHYHDLGKLMFAFTCFWAFCGFSQYMLIWYGNIPEETIFYSHRWKGCWKVISLILPIGHFAIPFVLLMSRLAKRNLKFLSIMAIWMLVMHFIDLHWLILPNFHHESFHFSWLDVTTLIGFAGIFLGIFGRKLSQQLLVSVNDPNLETSIHHISR